MKRQAGFTLLELLVTLSLIVTAAAVAGRIFFTSVNSMAATATAANAQAAAEHCDSILRQDVWAALRIDHLTPQECVLDTSDGRVRWTISNDLFCRSANSSTSTWPAESLHFELSTQSVALADKSGKTLRVFTSPMSMLEDCAMNYRRSGVTMILAILSMAIVSAAVIAVSENSVAEIRSVGRRIAADQLDQLLLASILSAEQHMVSPTDPGESWSLKLPSELSDAGVQLTLISKTQTAATVEVDAVLRRLHAKETIQLAPQASSWTFKSATLE